MQGIEAVLEGITQAAQLANKAVEGDYTQDDLLYCGKCNTPKQCKVENPFIKGRIDIKPCMCRCRSEEVEKEDRERKRCELEGNYDNQRCMGKSEKELLNWLNKSDYTTSERLIAERKFLMQKICFGEDNLTEWTFENAHDQNEKIIIAAKNFVEKFEVFKSQGKGLLFFGDVGRGKSYAAACIANALIEKEIPVHMTNFARIANTVQGMFEGKQEYYDSFNQYSLLIIDDLAAERKTEYMQEIVFQVIDARSRSGLPLIVTTNLTSEELKKPTDIAYKRTFSRLLEMCHPIKVEGEDKRKIKLKDDFEATNDLLGI